MAVIHFSKMSSQVGELTLAASPAGVCLVSFGRSVTPVAKGFDFQRSEDGLVGEGLAALEAYFAGRLTRFDLPLDLTLATPFGQKISKLLLEVGFGELTSYGALATAAGSSARAVGAAVGANVLPVIVPCHRVVAADGSLGGFSGGLDRKRTLLALEGHEPLAGGWAPRRRKVPV
jgi:methylated-DNA-[protein]-cysteine S-methyltransferase